LKKNTEIIEKVQKLIISFAGENLTQEETDLCLHIWDKLVRQKKLDIAGTTPTMWAAAVIWSFCRANLKKEKGLTLDSVCSFFAAGKATVAHKAGNIIAMLEIDASSPEFVSRKTPENTPLKIKTEFTLPDSNIREETLRILRGPPSQRMQAEEALNNGLDMLEQEKEEEAVLCFLKSLEIDPSFADGYNHLGDLSFRKGDWAQAESYFRKALELAAHDIKGVPRGAYWGVLESRPYMRALMGTGLTVWKQGRLEEALAIFEKMLKLNSNDNQGARYLIGPIYHQMGYLTRAAEWYQRSADNPHIIFNYGLLLAQQNKLEMAAETLILGIVENYYIAPLLLNEQLPESHREQDSAQQDVQYAEDYLKLYGILWQKQESALKLLRTIWDRGEARRMPREYVSEENLLKHNGKGNFGLAKYRLMGTARIKNLARIICAGLKEDSSG
jgi:tetratricopeptide (TPR) repeat protein